MDTTGGVEQLGVNPAAEDRSPISAAPVKTLVLGPRVEDVENRLHRPLLLPVAAAAVTTPSTTDQRTGKRPRIRALPQAATWPRCTLKLKPTLSKRSTKPELPGSASPTAWRKAPSSGSMGAQTTTTRIGRTENQMSGTVSEHEKQLHPDSICFGRFRCCLPSLVFALFAGLNARYDNVMPQVETEAQGRIALRRGEVEQTGATVTATVKSHSSAVSKYIYTETPRPMFEARFCQDKLGALAENMRQVLLLRTGMPCRAGGPGGGH